MSEQENRLWSPWRSEHMERFVDRHRPDDDLTSLFERIASSRDDDEHLVVWRGRTVFVLMNLFPYNNGHLMIAPYRKVSRFVELTEEERHEMADAAAMCQTWLTDCLAPEGFNIGMNVGKAGGAGVPGHVHMHVVPRWSGDTNFMPTIADVKVIPQSIQETYRRLRAAAERSA